MCAEIVQVAVEIVEQPEVMEEEIVQPVVAGEVESAPITAIELVRETPSEISPLVEQPVEAVTEELVSAEEMVSVETTRITSAEIAEEPVHLESIVIAETPDAERAAEEFELSPMVALEIPTEESLVSIESKGMYGDMIVRTSMLNEW